MPGWVLERPGALVLRHPWLALGGAGAAFVLGAFAVVASGVVPIKASSGHWAVTEWLLQFAKRRSVVAHSYFIQAPPLDDPALVLKGAGHFEYGCRPCHAGPGGVLPRIPRAMTPHPPDLVPRMHGWQPEQLFYIVKHGVKFTGMPAWPAQERDDEVWAVVAFLLRLPDLDERAYQELVNGGKAAPDIAAIDDLNPPQVVPEIEQSCSRCHGADGLGRGAGAFPRLAGQRFAYLDATLQAYANGERHSGIMEPLVAGMDRDRMREIARYYAQLERPATSDPGPASMAEIGQGAAIATEGLEDQLVPACVNCHGPGGQRRADYPVLAGQYADYLEQQLGLFKSQSRGGTAFAHIMQQVAGQLTAEQMRAVARYYASLPAEPAAATR